MTTSHYERQTMVDRITYMASLVTSVKDVDPYLDKLRAITARSDFTPQNMSDEQYATLVNLQQQLEHYLVEREFLRSFTPDSLQVQVEQHLTGNQSARHGLQQMLAVLGIAASAAVLVMLFPVLSPDTQQRIILAGAVTSSIMNLGAAWLFLSALPAFTSQLRRAFMYICAGIVLFSLSLLAQPLIEVWNLRTTSDIATLAVMPVVFLSSLFMYAGIKRYAVLAGIKSWLLRTWILLIPALPLIIAAFLIHTSATGSARYIFSISIMLHALVVLLTVVSVILLAKIVRGVADLYKPPVRALLQAVVVLMIGTMIFAGIITEVGPRLTGPIAIGLFAFLIIMGGMLLRAGYKFNKISRY